MAMTWFSRCSEAKRRGVGPAEPLIIMYPVSSIGVLSPPNVYCLVINAPCGTETLQADGQVTRGAAGSENISSSPGVDVTGEASAVSLRPAEAGSRTAPEKHHIVRV